VLTGRTVTWSSSNLAVATVSASGLVTAGAVASQATITATSEGQSGTATVTVVSKAPAATVTVTPATARVAVGQTVLRTATTRDANGEGLGRRMVRWTSDNAVVAAADGTGVARGVGAGQAMITATSEGKSGSASVTVTAPSGAPECATPQPGWIWCDDFEQNR